jgi:hypothetical protein
MNAFLSPELKIRKRKTGAKIKRKYCLDNGFNFLQIWECYWNAIKNDEDKKNKYIEYVKKKLNIE